LTSAKAKQTAAQAREGAQMTRIELTEKESAVLIEILESFLSDLKTERVGTDNKGFHAELTERERFVEDLMNRLRMQGPV
jgi:hypothetical protein